MDMRLGCYLPVVLMASFSGCRTLSNYCSSLPKYATRCEAERLPAGPVVGMHCQEVEMAGCADKIIAAGLAAMMGLRVKEDGRYESGSESLQRASLFDAVTGLIAPTPIAPASLAKEVTNRGWVKRILIGWVPIRFCDSKVWGQDPSCNHKACNWKLCLIYDSM